MKNRVRLNKYKTIIDLKLKTIYITINHCSFEE